MNIIYVRIYFILTIHVLFAQLKTISNENEEKIEVIEGHVFIYAIESGQPLVELYKLLT